MSNRITIYKYKMEDIHYKGISTLQRYYGKKLNTSNDENPQETKGKLQWLSEIKKSGIYTTKERIHLNKLRDEYLREKKSTP